MLIGAVRAFSFEHRRSLARSSNRSYSSRPIPAVVVPSNSDQVDVADRLRLRPEPEQVRDDSTILTSHPRCVAELVHEHRMVHTPDPLGRVPPELLQLGEDV